MTMFAVYTEFSLLHPSFLYIPLMAIELRSGVTSALAGSTSPCTTRAQTLDGLISLPSMPARPRDVTGGGGRLART